MACPLSIVSAVAALVWNNLRVLADIFTFFRLCLRSPAAVAAENLFLRKQLGLYVERKTTPRRATAPICFTLAQLCRFFDWRFPHLLASICRKRSAPLASLPLRHLPLFHNRRRVTF